MMCIDGHWEEVNDLHDISRIIRDNYNRELANKLDEFIEEIEVYDYNYERIAELEGVIEEIQSLVRYV